MLPCLFTACSLREEEERERMRCTVEREMHPLVSVSVEVSFRKHSLSLSVSGLLCGEQKGSRPGLVCVRCRSLSRMPKPLNPKP
jgi:hypothetical protein